MAIDLSYLLYSMIDYVKKRITFVFKKSRSVRSNSIYECNMVKLLSQIGRERQLCFEDGLSSIESTSWYQS